MVRLDDGVWHVDLGEADPATEYRLASVSKILTALTMERLEEQGYLDLAVPVHQVLDELEGAVLPGYPPATLRDLLQHRSGIGTSGDKLVAVLPPGLHRQYWNQGYDLLAKAAETSTGSPFADLVQREVAHPLQMEGLRVCVQPETGLGIGSGGFCARRQDLERLARHLLIRGVSAPQGMGTLGFSVGLGQQGGVLWLRQGGAASGAGAEMVLFPSLGVGVVILTDQRYLPPLFTDVWRILFRRLELPRTDFRASAPRPLQPFELAGEYVSPVDGASVVVDAPSHGRGSLLLTRENGTVHELVRLNGNRFALRTDDSEDRMLEAMVRAKAAGVAEFLATEDRVEGCLLDGRFLARTRPEESGSPSGQAREVRQQP